MNYRLGKNNYIAPDAINVILTGEENYVHSLSKNISVIGSSGCIVYSKAHNISILNSSGIIVEAGIKNVSVINSSGTTVSINNKVYINNIDFSNVLQSGAAYKENVAIYTGVIPTINVDLTVSTYIFDCSSGNVTVNLPPANRGGYRVTFIKIDSSGNTVTINANGGDLINGSSSRTISTQYGCDTLLADYVSRWYKVN